MPEGLVCAAQTALVPVSNRFPPRGYDEPESLSYAISSICAATADEEQHLPFLGATSPICYICSPGIDEEPAFEE